MFFKNLMIFRFPATLDLSGLSAALEANRLKDVGTLELMSVGFIPPMSRDGAMLHEGSNATLLSVGTQTRMLPAAVLNRELEKKLAELEEREGRKPGGRARKRLKEDLVHELLPRAFVKPGRVDAILLDGLLIVDTSSRRTAEMVGSEIRNALGSFPAVPLNAEVAPRSVLTGWIAGEPLPEGLSIGEEAQLRDAADGGGVVTARNQDLLGDEIAKHLEAGKQVTRLALVHEDHVSFVLGEDLVVRKLRFLDGAVDSIEGTDHDDLMAELDARFALMVSELRQVFPVLESALKLSQLS